MKRHASLIIIISALMASLVGLVFMLNLTSPLSAGPLGVLVVFALIYGVSFCSLLLLIRFGEVIYRAVRSPRKTVVGQEKAQVVRRRLIWIAAALSFAPIFLISLNSIGQLSVRDVILIIVIEALAIFYITRRI